MVVIVDEHTTTERGEDGFGSTGMCSELADIYEIMLGHATSAKLIPQEERYTLLRSQIPAEYHNFLDVFDTNLAMSACPPSRPGYDFEIHFQEGSKLPPPHHPYQLSKEENCIMKEWLDSMIEMGMIERCTTRCPTAAPVFFVGKKDGTK